MPRKTSIPSLWVPRTWPERVWTTVTVPFVSRAATRPRHETLTRGQWISRRFSKRREAACNAIFRSLGAGFARGRREPAQPRTERPWKEALPERYESVKGRKRSSGLLGRVNAACAAVGGSGASRKTRLGTLGGPAQACSGFRGDLQGPNPVEKGHPKGLRGSQSCAGRQRCRAPYHDLKRHWAVEASSGEIQNSHQPKADQHPYAARDVGGGNPLAPPLLDFEPASAAGGVEAQRPGEQTTRAAARAALANDADAKKAQELHGPILARREGPAA